jgi:PAS domain S-box-containing protein
MSMPVILSALNTNSLLPHGFCINWTPALLWLYVIADALIVLAYYSIPLTLAYFVWRRKDLQFSWIFMLFGAFILACGTTHLLGIVVLWNPIYWIDAGMKGITAIISVFTAIALVRIIPKALKLPSPAQLETEVQDRVHAYEKLKIAQTSLVKANQTLECRVNERTQELQKNEEYLRIAATVFESQEGMFVTDVNKVILRVNHAFTKITGYSAEEAIGSTPNLLSSGKHSDEFYTTMWEAINSKGAWEGEIWNRHKNGEIYSEQITITAVKDASGIVTNYVATAIDITDRKYQEQLRLAHEVALRHVLVREVHHRIKNSLHGITGLLQRFVVQYPELGFPIRKAISQVQSIAVIHGLHGRDVPSCIQFCELIGEIAANHQFLWPESILIDIPPNWIPCQISSENEVPLALVINELVLNALKHGAPEEGVSISLRRDLQQDVVILTITNSGQLSHDVDFPNTPEKGVGLELVMSLMPEEGATLTWEQRDGVVITRLVVTQPTITFRPEKVDHHEKL